MKKITLIFILFLLAYSVSAATVSHNASQIRAGMFGEVYSGNWSFMNGSVGIGTSSPTEVLTVSGAGITGSAADIKIIGTGSVGAGLTLDATGTNGDEWLLISTASGATGGGGNIGFYNRDTSNYRFYIQSGGNVGIGTTTPNTLLHIYKGDLVEGTENNLLTLNGQFDTSSINYDDIIGIAFKVENNQSGTQTTTSIASSYQATYNALLLQPNGGNVGIGTTNPGEELEVAGNINSTGGDICITGGNCLSSVSSSGGGIWNRSGSNVFLNDTSNNVGIGVTDPDTTFEVNNGSGAVFKVNTTSGATEFWNPAEGAGDYINMWHSGTSGYLNSQSGGLYLRTENTDRYYLSSTQFRPEGTQDLGGTANEWRALYLGENTSSGVYFGLDQDARIWYNSSDASLFFSGDKFKFWDDAMGANDYGYIYHDGANAYIGGASGGTYLQSAGTTRAILTSAGVAPGSANNYALGGTTAEWIGLYLSEDANSGAYFGLDQDVRQYLDSSDNQFYVNASTNTTNLITPDLKVWDDAEGANDYVNIRHDGANGIINSGSGVLRVEGGGIRFAGGHVYYNGANTADSGTASNEWRGLYLGEDASSGAYFGLDQNTRCYYNETNEDAFICQTDSGPVFTQDATGIGIGTTAPTNALTVVGDLNVTGTSYLGDMIITADNITVNNLIPKDGNVVKVYGELQTENVTVGDPYTIYETGGDMRIFNSTDDVFTIEDDGDVGIGLTDPSEELEVAGTIASGATAGDGFGLWGGPATTYGMWMTSAGAQSLGDVTGYKTVYTMSAGTDRGFVWEYAGAPTMAFNPYTGRLTVDGITGYDTDVIEWERDDQAIKGILGFGKGGVNNVFMGSRTDHDLLLMSNNATVMTLENDGDVGIGTTDPQYALHVSASSNDGIAIDNDNAILGLDTSTSNYTQLLFWNGGTAYYGRNPGNNAVVDQHEFRTAGNTRLTIDISGNVGIGDSTPGEPLEVAGDINSTGGDICISGGNCLSTVPSTDTDTNASTACAADELLSGTGTCVDYSGWDQDASNDVSDTNASTACSGTNVYLDGEGNCDTVIDTTVGNCSGTESCSNVFYKSGGTVTGSLFINGNLSVIGDMLNATVTNQYLNGTFYPSQNNVFDIGSSSAKWNEGFFGGTLEAGGYTEGGSNTLSNDISGNAATATLLAANGPNCAAGQFAAGVNESGGAESCATPTDIDTNASTACSADEFLDGDGNCVDYSGWDQNQSNEGNLTGSGAANRAAFWTGTTALSYNDNFTWDNANNRLGIGTTDPNETLHVIGNIGISDGAYIDTGKSSGYALYIGDTSTTGQYGNLWIKGSLDGTTGLNVYPRDEAGSPTTYAHFGYQGSNDYVMIGTASDTDSLVIDTSGQVGIGTTNPGETLDVAGDINATGDICIDGGNCLSSAGGVTDVWINESGDTTGALTSDLNIDADTFVISYDDNRVGIGTDNPFVKFHINGSADQKMIIQDDGSGNTAVGFMSWYDSSARIGYLGFTESSDGDFRIVNEVSGGDIIISPDTNFGIGAIDLDPTQKLHVEGNANITGNIYYGGNLSSYGADFAEMMTQDESLEAGDVVCLNENMNVIKCVQHGQNSVTGVVSQKPTIIGNAEAPNAVPVGIVGIVTTKVKGPVAQFDLLTTSPRPGHAEKATSEDFGAIIGKAMQPCQEDICEIKVLIGLR